MQLSQKLAVLAEGSMLGVAQIYLCNRLPTAACFLLALALVSPVLAVAALLGSAVATLLAGFFGYSWQERQQGLAGYNAALIATAAVAFFAITPVSVLLTCGLVVASLPLGKWLSKAVVPYTAPFVLLAWVLMGMGALLSLPSSAIITQASTFMQLNSITNSYAEVMLQVGMPWVGLAVMVGLGLTSLRGLGLSLLCVLIALGIVKLLPFIPVADIQAGLWGYNVVLTAMAFRDRHLAMPMVAMLLAVAIQLLFFYSGYPALTAPFVLAAWITLILAKRYLPSP